jgi:hypothetical protein
MSLSWFKHYNTAHEGQLIGDLIITGQHDAALLVYVIMELISRFEDETNRGRASVPIERIARAMNMKPSKIDRLLGHISAVSRSDLVCEMDEERPRNRVFLMRNWLKFQETRGGKRQSKSEQNDVRSKKEEVRSKKKEERSKKEEYISGGVANASPRTLGSAVWDAYAEAYGKRYGVAPVRNATTNSQCANLAKRLGASAVEVVRFYLTHNDGYYLRTQHPVGACLQNCESLHTQWQRGQAVTSTQVRQAEKTISNADTLDALRKEWGA